MPGRFFDPRNFQILDPDAEAERQAGMAYQQAMNNARAMAPAGPAGALAVPGVASSMLSGALQGAAKPVMQNAPVVPGFNAMSEPNALPGDPRDAARALAGVPFGGLAYLTPEQAHEGASVLPFYGAATDLEQRNLGNVLMDVPELIPGVGLAAKGAGSLAPLLKGMGAAGMIGGARGYSGLNSFSPLLDAQEKLAQIRDLPRRGGKRDNARRALWNEEGVYEGPEGKLRFEIDDSQIEYNPAALEPSVNEDNALTGRLGDVIKHPELFKAYPELENLNVVMRQSTGNSPQGQASYKRWGISSPNDELGMWTLDGQPGEWPKSSKLVLPGVDPSQQPLPGMLEPDSALKFTPQQENTLLHEVQHFVQNLEKHAEGGSPREFRNKEWARKDYNARNMARALTSETDPLLDATIGGPAQRRAVGDAQELTEMQIALKKPQGTVEELTRRMAGQALPGNFVSRYQDYKDLVDSAGLAPPQLDLFARPGRNVFNKETAERLTQHLELRNPTAYDKYANLYGEAEARMTGDSRNMTALERRLSHPEARFDRPRDRTTVTVQGSRKTKVKPLSERRR